MGSLLKRYFAKLEGIEAYQLCHVSIMPCLDKRKEAQREMQAKILLRVQSRENQHLSCDASEKLAGLECETKNDSFDAACVTPNPVDAAPRAVECCNETNEVELVLTTEEFLAAMQAEGLDRMIRESAAETRPKPGSMSEILTNFNEESQKV